MIEITTLEQLEEFAKKRAINRSVGEQTINKSLDDLRALLMSRSFGCKQNTVTAIVNVFIKHMYGEQFIITSRDAYKDDYYSYPLFSVIVPLESRNSHNYSLNKACMVIKPALRRCLKHTGNTGNRHHGEWRYATTEEITEYFEALRTTKITIENIVLEAY